jgi:hypothetical protein
MDAVSPESDDVAILRLVQTAFARCERPEHFTDYKHCCECSEHDELLRSRDNNTLQSEDVGNAGWDPLCFVQPSGFGYFFPALARLALTEPNPARDWYLPQLLFHLTYEGEANRHLQSFDQEQRHAVAALLQQISTTRAVLVDEWSCRDELRHAITLWSGP